MPELDITFVWKCFETEESSNWEVRYNPSYPEDEQVELREVEGQHIFEMSIESARALAAILSAPVQKHDFEQSFQKLINSTQGGKKNG